MRKLWPKRFLRMYTQSLRKVYVGLRKVKHGLHKVYARRLRSVNPVSWNGLRRITHGLRRIMQCLRRVYAPQPMKSRVNKWASA